MTTANKRIHLLPLQACCREIRPDHSTVQCTINNIWLCLLVTRNGSHDIILGNQNHKILTLLVKVVIIYKLQ